jgi:hypothetical protein
MSNINDFGMPFTSISGDRQYSAEDFREFFRMLVSSGVVADVSDELEIVPQGTPDRSINVSVGGVLVRGAIRILSAAETLTINENTSGSARVDRIVARLDIADRQLEFVVLQGTPGAGAPALTRTSLIWELSLAQVACANGFTAITTSEITDERDDTDLCGYSSTFKGLEDLFTANINQPVKTTSSPTFADATIASKLLSTYLGYLNQDVKSTGSPTFADATIAGMIIGNYLNQDVRNSASPTFADATIASKLLSTYLGYLNQDVRNSASPTFADATIASKLLSTYLGYLNQDLKSSASPTFSAVTLSAGKSMSVSYVDYGDISSTTTIGGMEVGEVRVYEVTSSTSSNRYLKTPSTAGAKYLILAASRTGGSPTVVTTGEIIGPSIDFTGGAINAIYQGALLRIS